MRPSVKCVIVSTASPWVGSMMLRWKDIYFDADNSRFSCWFLKYAHHVYEFHHGQYGLSGYKTALRLQFSADYASIRFSSYPSVKISASMLTWRARHAAFIVMSRHNYALSWPYSLVNEESKPLRIKADVLATLSMIAEARPRAISLWRRRGFALNGKFSPYLSWNAIFEAEIICTTAT